jgi:hypothetical protein
MHGVVQPVGVVVLEHLAGALLEVGGGHDLQVGVERQPLALLGPSGARATSENRRYCSVSTTLGSTSLAFQPGP